MSATATPAKPARPWLDRDRMFQMRLPVFVVAVAGCALICWAWIFHRDHTDPDRVMTKRHIATLRGSSAAGRVFAAQSLDGIPPALFDEGAVALMAAVKDPDAKVRGAAVRSLATSLVFYFQVTGGELPPRRDAATLAILEALRDHDGAVRASARLALDILLRDVPLRNYARGAVKLDPKVANGTLRSLLDDPDPTTALAAFRAMRAIGADPALMFAALKRLAREADASGRREIVAPLAEALRARHAPADTFLSLLGDADEEVRGAVAPLLALGWGDDPRVARALTDRLKDATPAEREALVSALASLPSVPADAVPTLVEFLSHLPTARVYRADGRLIGLTAQAIAQAIRKAPPEAARAALPRLFRASLGVNGKALRGLVEAIFAIDPRSEEAHEVQVRLVRVLRRRPNGDLAAQAAELLALAAPIASDEAIEALTEAVKDTDRQVFYAAMGTLRSIGRIAEGAAPRLIRQARQDIDDGVVPAPLLGLLVEFGPESPEVAALLIRVARMAEFPESDHERRDASAFLKSLSGRGRKLLPALRAARAAADANGRAQADAVIRAIEEP